MSEAEGCALPDEILLVDLFDPETGANSIERRAGIRMPSREALSEIEEIEQARQGERPSLPPARR